MHIWIQLKLWSGQLLPDSFDHLIGLLLWVSIFCNTQLYFVPGFYQLQCGVRINFACFDWPKLETVEHPASWSPPWVKSDFFALYCDMLHFTPWRPIRSKWQCPTCDLDPLQIWQFQAGNTAHWHFDLSERVLLPCLCDYMQRQRSKPQNSRHSSITSLATHLTLTVHMCQARHVVTELSEAFLKTIQMIQHRCIHIALIWKRRPAFYCCQSVLTFWSGVHTWQHDGSQGTQDKFLPLWDRPLRITN